MAKNASQSLLDNRLGKVFIENYKLMMTPIPTFSSIEPCQDDADATVQALRAQATRIETPCGAGTLVWLLWQPSDGSLDAKAPVLLLHGGSGSWTHWLRNIGPLVAAGRCMLVPDLPGFGDSAAPEGGVDADACTAPLAAGLRQLLGHRACDVVGFSFGAMVAGFLAAQHPARVARLMLVGAPAMGEGFGQPIDLLPWRQLTDPAHQHAAHRHNLAALMLHQPEAITALAVQLQATNVARDRMRGRSLQRTGALVQALKRVACPVHAVYGREDVLYVGQFDALAQAFQYAPRFETLTLVASAGHWVQFEQADAFNQIMLGWLD